MKASFISILSIIYLLFAVFGIALQGFGFDGNHHIVGKCLSVTINGYGCPDASDNYGSANFHIKAFKTFSTSFLNDWVFGKVNLAYLAIVVILILGIVRICFQKNSWQQFSIYNSNHLSWLSLFELSPTLKF